MKNKKYIIPFAIATVLVIALIVTVVALGTSDNGLIAKNVFIADVNVSGQTVEKAVETATVQYLEADPYVEVNCEGKNIRVNLSDFGQIDFETTAKNAHLVGRSGNVFTKAVAKLFPKKKVIPLSIIINEGFFNEKINSGFADEGNSYSEETFEISGDMLKVTVGSSGNLIIFDDFEGMLKTLGMNKNAKVEAKREYKEYQGVDVDALYEKVYTEPADAYYDKEGGKLVPHVLGYSFDKTEAKELLGGLKNGEQVEIKLSVIYPKVLEDDLTGKMFKDVLGSYTTNYNTAEVDRTHNMYLAALKVNGTVLEPGAVFSYNGVVGERTVAAGYRNAKIFENGRVVDGLAGGICQVSSTLYNAALYSNLEIVERENHSFPVAYTPKGQDATVVMNYIDFKFKNNTSRPIKITAIVSDGICKVEILGTKEENFKVEIINSVLSQRERPVEYEEDPSLEKGVEKVVQSGSDGYTVATTRKVYVNSTLVKTETMPSSYYIPLKKIIKRNTAEEEQPAEGEVVPEENQGEVVEEPTETPEDVPAEIEPTDTPVQPEDSQEPAENTEITEEIQ